MKLRSLILLLALFLPSVADAQIFNPWPTQQDTCDTCPQSTADYSPPVAAIVQIIAKAPGETSYGTGTLIESDDPRGIVVTCAHLFDAQTDSVIVIFPGGEQAEAEILYCNLVREITVLAIPCTGVAPIALAPEPALKGDVVRAGGYGTPRERYRTIGGPAIGYLPTTINYGESLVIPGETREGDSGGPMLNERGELVGVTWGTSECRTRGTYARRIRKILAQLFGREETPAMTPMRPGPKRPSPPDPLPIPKPSTVADHLDKIRGQVKDDISAAREVNDERLTEIEVALAAIRGGLGETKPAPRSPSLLEAALPGVLTALGWSGPPSIAALLALRTAGWAIRRRRKKRTAQKPPTSSVNDDYAAQLASVYALSGRSPMTEVTLGREYDQELEQAATSSDGAMASWADDLRQRVARRVNRIHDHSPSPAEPIGA